MRSSPKNQSETGGDAREGFGAGGLATPGLLSSSDNELEGDVCYARKGVGAAVLL